MEIKKTYTTDIERSILYQSWVSEDMLVEPAIRIESEPKVGGHYKLYSSSLAGEAVMNGVFKEVIPNQKLHYSWHWEGSDETSYITVEFREEEGLTIVDLHHYDFKTVESRDMHDWGWDSYFEGLIAKIKSTNS